MEYLSGSVGAISIAEVALTDDELGAVGDQTEGLQRLGRLLLHPVPSESEIYPSIGR